MSGCSAFYTFYWWHVTFKVDEFIRRLTTKTGELNMAFFYNIVYNAETKRHDLEFVNQQYDFLMYIYYNEETRSYQLNVPLEEAQKISQYWGGRDFDLEYWLKLAEEKLTLADQERKK